MNIYRYTYIKKEIKITNYQCAKTKTGDYIITADCKKYGNVYKNDSLDKMIDNENYIMWSLTLDDSTKKHFLDLILERKKKIYKSFADKTFALEDEILQLELLLHRGLEE